MVQSVFDTWEGGKQMGLITLLCKEHIPGTKVMHKLFRQCVLSSEHQGVKIIKYSTIKWKVSDIK